MSSVIKVENLTKVYKVYDSRVKKLVSLLNPFSKKQKYNLFQALTDVSFDVDNGQIIGIIGNNGAGKSTLLKQVTGVSFPTEGKVIVDGRISSLLELGSGFNPEFTGIENIYFNGSLMGMTEEEIDKAKDKIIEFADIGDFINQPVKVYSSGMYARLAFAVSINVNPDILIVDEILSVGDVGFQKKCMEKFEEFKSQGKTILYVTHGLSTVQEYCEKAIWLQKGKVVEIGEAREVVDNYLESLDDNETEEVVGAKFVEIKSVKTSSGKTEFNYGDNIEIEIEYEVFRDDINSPGMTIELRKSFGDVAGETRMSDQYVSGINSNVDGFKIPWNKGLNKVKFSFDNLKLKQGCYYLDISFSESQNLVNLEIEENVLDFKIKANIDADGFIYLDNEWDISTNDNK